MSEYRIQDTTLTGIADAIRSKTGSAATILVSEMANEIESIPTGGGGATIDTLWSDSDGATVGTENTMTGSINDYDLICVKIGNPTDIQQSNLYTQLTFAVAGYTSGELIGWEGYYQRYCHMSFSGDKFSLVASGANGEASGYRPRVYKIIGIKY